MNPITIITIVVVALLTVVIFGLMWLGYSSCLKAYKLEVKNRLHDVEIIKEHRAKKKSKGGLVGVISSYVALFALLGLFVTGLVYKASGENFHINNTTVLVIKSGSMSEFYDEERAAKYEAKGYNPNLQFGIGDICVFELMPAEEELIKGEVYGYKHKDRIITHRWVELDNGQCRFCGDNNAYADAAVQRENVLYHYVGSKVPGVGAFILYAQSYLGLWSLCGIVGVTISSEVVYYQIRAINKKRLKELGVRDEK